MKNIVILFISLFVFSSCSKDNEDSSTTTDYYGEWILVKMSGSMQNSETTGSAMAWQETYLFNPNGTFRKTRVQNSVTTMASGAYTTQKISGTMYLKLNYTKNNDIIGSCNGSLTEELYFSSNNTLSSTWRNCDGPGLDYQKIN